MKLRFLFFFIFFSASYFSQAGNSDSVGFIIQHAANDTSAVKSLKHWEDAIYLSDPALDFVLCKRITALCAENLKKSLSEKEKKFFNKKYASTLYCLGNVYSNKGDYSEAIACHEQSLKLFETMDDKKGIASALNNLGLVYVAQGENAKAIDIYVRSLKISEELGDKMVQEALLNNIGNVYHDMGNNAKALQYQSKALALQQEVHDSVGVAVSLSSIGNLYKDKAEYAQAIKFYEKGLAIDEALGDKRAKATTYNNMAIVYNRTGNGQKAFDYYMVALKLNEEIGEKQGISTSLNNIGEYYTTKKDIKTAIGYFERSLKIGQEIGDIPQIQDASQNLYQAYKMTHRDEKALAMHELFIQMRDSIYSEESKKEIVRQEFKYEYEKKVEADRIIVIEDKKVVDAHFAQEKMQRQVLYLGTLLLIGFGAFMFNRFKTTQKRKAIIEKQKNILEERQKEILDSIHYAKRIQRSFLPTEKYIAKTLKRLVK
jgi:tetratricopeptide (TPR) repeat protein